MLFDQIVSLGPTCKARYQVERAKQATRFTTLRNSPANFPKSIFSWQITPIEAVIEGIRCDFLGMFEVEDLFVDTDGVVVNRRFGTRHVHEFPKPPRDFNIEDHYEHARGRHDHLCNLTRNALDVAAKRTLFVFGGYSSSDRQRELSEAIATRRAPSTFSLIFVDDTHLSPTRPGANEWAGNDPYWDAIMHPYQLRPSSPLLQRLGTMAKEQVVRLSKHFSSARF